MLEVSRFYGVVITMYFKDHSPPHFHARYGESRVAIAIENLAVLSGALPPRAMALVTEWGLQHREELFQNWAFARSEAPLRVIEPLR